ncbi:DUF3800 domain-containing protein [Agrobacterium sp. FDAARGOS_525]|uniref:DUF3800 domain-containing protein n=1 Tax=Agrobacterium sp. FDAARGOS_525 TaxID=2420311 RepID=UPI000F669B87|nr:DUF3800 domain-containing protein [Agrobacterium sp. FDAARGOS_525]RSC37648.1 DUF3800 domain-containing protein [Agrobacterium sp. FDAARGOS_525]
MTTFNLYCDESCHLENDHIQVMVWGAVYCDLKETRRISEHIRALKETHGLKRNFEIKWTKVSPARIAFYQEVLQYALEEKSINFRGLLVADKSILDHGSFTQTHDEWYYKMYFTMLKYIFTPGHKYRVYLDIKDTQGGAKTRQLHEVLANSLHDFDRSCIERVEQIRSHESELMQVADLIIGAIGYANRGLSSSAGKSALVEQLKAVLGSRALSTTSTFGSQKFNLLAWSPKGYGK